MKAKKAGRAGATASLSIRNARNRIWIPGFFRTRKNPLTGALVVADVVLKTQSRNGNENDRAIQQDILLLCREALPSHKVPAVINFVAALAVAETGKLIRRYA